MKLAHIDLAGDRAKARRRFEREVQAIAALRSPNTVQLYDYGQTPDGRLYCAMELVDGLNLETLVQLRGRLPPERVVQLTKLTKLRGRRRSRLGSETSILYYCFLSEGDAQ